MTALIETLSDFFDNPKTVLSNLTIKRRFGSGLLGYFIGALSLFLWLNIGDASFSVIGSIFSVSMLFCFLVFIGYLTAALIHIFLDITGESTSASGLFILIGISEFVKSLLIPAAILVYYFNTCAVLVFSIVAVLQICFIIYAVSHAYTASKIKVVMAVVIPLIMITAVFTVFIIFMIADFIMNIADLIRIISF